MNQNSKNTKAVTSTIVFNKLPNNETNHLKKCIWVYFYLLIFEGALRKWVLPGLSGPLLLVRDPLAIWMLIRFYRRGYMQANLYIVLMWILTFLAFMLAIFVGHGNIAVASYGARITVIQFPVIFIIGTVFDRNDVIKMGIALLWISIPMTLLVALQFFSPQSDWVNKTVGGGEGSGFAAAQGFYRVPGTFSFTNGLTLFYELCGSYIFFFWLTISQKTISIFLLVISTICLLAAVPLSISRSLFFDLIILLLFLLLIASKNKTFLGKTIVGILVGGLVIFFLSKLSFFQVASSVFTERFTNASESEGGLEGTLGNRFLGDLWLQITNVDLPFWGLGLGMGTNAGSQLLTGSKTFLISEGEWGRLIGEMGFYIGFTTIIIRQVLTLQLLIKSWNVSNNNPLPWLLFSFAVILISQGPWAQPTALGFSVLGAGLLFGSLKNSIPIVVKK